MRAVTARLLGDEHLQVRVVVDAHPWGSARREHFVRPGRYTFSVVLSTTIHHVVVSELLADRVGLGTRLLPNFVFAGATWSD